MKFVRAALMLSILTSTRAAMLPGDPLPLFRPMPTAAYMTDLFERDARPACDLCTTSVVLAPEIAGTEENRFAAPQSGLLGLLRQWYPER